MGGEVDDAEDVAGDEVFEDDSSVSLTGSDDLQVGLEEEAEGEEEGQEEGGCDKNTFVIMEKFYRPLIVWM